MKFGIPLFVVLSTTVVLAQDEDPFSDAVKQVEAPLREVSSIPASIIYEQVDDNRHRYTVTGIYNASQRAKEEDKRNRANDSARNRGVINPFAADGQPSLGDDYPESIYEGTVPDCDDFTVDFETRKCTFLTSRKLMLPELADAIDQLAWLGGDIPYWSELEARDIARSAEFDSENYTVEETEEDFPPNLAWFWVPKDRQVSSLIGLDGFEQGQLIFTPTTAHCMAHSRFAIRVLDADGRILWHEDSTALADVRFAIADVDRDGLHEILLDRNDHGKASRFLIERSIEQNAAEQPATRSESK